MNIIGKWPMIVLHQKTCFVEIVFSTSILCSLTEHSVMFVFGYEEHLTLIKILLDKISETVSYKFDLASIPRVKLSLES